MSWSHAIGLGATRAALWVAFYHIFQKMEPMRASWNSALVAILVVVALEIFTRLIKMER